MPYLKQKAQIATDEHRLTKNHLIWSKDARGGLWQPFGIPGTKFKGIKSLKSTSVLYLKPKARIATDEHRWIKNHLIWSKDARGGHWQPSSIPGNKFKGIQSLKSISVPYLKPKSQIATDEHRLIKNHLIWSKDARGGHWQPFGIPGNKFEWIKSLKSISVPYL